jgi:alcohol dehydrogenase/propanol-preferring alcohol dehydrogenase
MIACDVDDPVRGAGRGAADGELARPADRARSHSQVSGAAVAGARLRRHAGDVQPRHGRAHEAALHARRPFGGEVTFSLPPIAQRAISIMGSYVGNLQELREVVTLARSGKLKATPVETRPATDVNRSLDELKAGKVVGRIALDFDRA